MRRWPRNATPKSAPRRSRPRSTGVLPEQGKDDIGSMFEDVYAEMPWHLAEQREQSLAESDGEAN